jgi:SAM-dependent methyltransferase
VSERIAEPSEALLELRRAAAQAAEAFRVQYTGEVEQYRREISLGIDEALDVLQRKVEAVSAGDPSCLRVVGEVKEYVSWMQWALWDLPYYAVAARPTLAQFRRTVAACGLIYISIRIFDDVIDEHYSYKGRHATVLASASQDFTRGRSAQGLTILAGLLVCFEGLEHLLSLPADVPASAPGRVISAIQRAVVGAIMEYSGSQQWSSAFYDLLVELKNVHYWQSLYAALDPELTSPLYPFLEKYYALAQNLNDVQDFDEDQRLQQPNLLAIHLRRSEDGHGECPPFQPDGLRAAPQVVEDLLAGKFLELGRQAGSLPPLEQAIAHLKLSEALEEAFRLGLFAPPKAPEAAPSRPLVLHLDVNSDLAAVMQQAGGDALEQVSCPVCQSDRASLLFQKQGFAYQRCQDCSHIYVSPRLRPALQAGLLDLEPAVVENEYLEVQRIYAESICHLLSLHAGGPRLLDIGFGRGYLLQMAQVYGFESYGLDSSLALVERLEPQFGQRVVRCLIGAEPIPWESFDVIVMCHVLEHLHDPAAALAEIRRKLNPGGLLYLAVPDMDSVAFRIFGKNWDVVNPLVHLQYFTGASLNRLIEKCEYPRQERVEFPRLREEVMPRWMRLMRQLGGSDTNELIRLAYRDE